MIKQKIKRWLGIDTRKASEVMLDEMKKLSNEGYKLGPITQAKFEELIEDINTKRIITLPQDFQTVEIPNDLEINGHRYVRVENDEKE